jgi:ABC-type lipoprotein release transport system permease subunit
MQEAYQYEEFLDAYLINYTVESDPEKMNRILEAMIRAEFSGAIRHVNQLFSAIVVGVVNSPNPATNANIAYIPLDVLQDEGGMMLEGHITELLIRAKDARDADLPGRNESREAITAALEQGLAARGQTLPSELAVFTWLDYVQDYLGFEALQGGATNVLTGLLLILAFLGISNTILLATLERTKEIGMMRAMGMTDNQMVAVYMIEAGFLGLFGSLLGIIVGCALNYPMVEYGVDISAMADALGGSVGFRVASLYRSMWNVPVIIGSGIAATIIASLMAYLPTRRAVKMPITETLRFD